jgi:predicted negative regulator of RcsB-dependent stress response
LTPAALDTGAPARGTQTKTGSLKSLFDFTTWGGKPGETFTQARQRLQQTIVDVPESERNRTRLELARFYFARGEGEEAVGLLKFIAKQVPDLRSHADFMALLGASEILAYRPDEGLKDLSDPTLSDEPEAELWQAVGFAQLRDWQQAEEKFSVRQDMLKQYPEPFFSRFFVLAIESALAAGKDHEAANWLDYVSNAPHQSTIDAALYYLRGVLAAKAGRASDAEDSWKAAERSNDQLYKIRAELALIDLGVSTASLTPAQAADRLEALRFGWRGDDLEVDILHRLGQFYIQAKNVKAGLNVLSQAITLYPSSPMAPAIRAEMASAFHDVFLGNLGKKLSALDNLTLYQQYRDLMPKGKEGDAIMRNLAERLVAVDLLDQASSILEDLVKNHLQGEEKDRAALRLGAIRLLDHKPEEAMAGLDLIGKDVLSPSLQNQRILLKARALAELNRNDEAAALLKDNTSPGAEMLRADIAMHTQKWGDAANAMMNLVGPPPPSGKTLTSEQTTELINAAIAYALNNDQPGLDKLGIDYGAAMAGTPQNDTFLMLTRPDKTGQLRDLAAAQAQLSQVDMFQGFLNNYRRAEAAEAQADKTQ